MSLTSYQTQIGAAKDYSKNYMNIRPPLVCHLLRNCLYKYLQVFAVRPAFVFFHVRHSEFEEQFHSTGGSVNYKSTVKCLSESCRKAYGRTKHVERRKLCLHIHHVLLERKLKENIIDQARVVEQL